MRSRKDRRSAFTLIEILVVLSIIGLLVALLISGVLSAREAARRAQCTNNLKQVGIAINSHLAQKNHYPRGENNYSAFVSLLPFLEQTPLFNSINLSKPRQSFLMPSDVNSTAFSTRLNVLICPSEGTGDEGLGHTTYGGNLGTGVGKYGRPDNGPFASSSLDPAIRDALIRDGLANTVAVSEFCRNQGMNDRNEKRAIFQLGSFNKSQFESMINECTGLNTGASPLAAQARGSCWGFDGIGSTLYDHNKLPNSHSCNGGGFLAGAYTA